MKPLYAVTRKKSEFTWGDEQEEAFEQAKMAVEQALPLSPRVPGAPYEFQVSVHDNVAVWSLWQLQNGRRVPLGFWSRTMPEAAERYTPFERQLLACYWALVETESITGSDPTVLRPDLPIMSWVLAPDTKARQGRAQQSSIVKWKW